ADRVLQSLVLALTHPVDEVRFHALSGAKELWKIDHALALKCVDALAAEASLVQAAQEHDSQLPFSSRRRAELLEAQAAYFVREKFFGFIRRERARA
ncbi:MAG TPA: hypothetical protein VE133_07565, partial [Candidatus Sulfotelmatobacter sp.]|nr:hypothetical protein [Candidatus Sulfotelmatobacter sp.]